MRLTPELTKLFEKITYLEFLTDWTGREFIYPPIFCWDKARLPELEKTIKSFLGVRRSANFMYLHFPFCRYRCAFCRQFSLAVKNQSLYDEYTDLIIKEIKNWRRVLGPIRPRVIYLGGGTPTLFRLEKVFRALDETFKLSGKETKINVESTVDALSDEMLKTIKKWGVYRLVIGLQSLDKKVLKLVNRPINQLDVLTKNYKKIRRAAPIINFELMTGLPEQTKKSFLNDIQKIIGFGPEGIHFYKFLATPLTQLGRDRRQIKRGQVDQGEEKAKELLNRAGYVWNTEDFVKNGNNNNVNPLIFEAYNSKRAWNEIPLGQSAFGSLNFEGGRLLLRNALSFENYRKKINGGGLAIENYHRLGRSEHLRYAILRRLFCFPFLDKDDFVSRQKINPFDYFSKELRILDKMKLIRIDGKRIYKQCPYREMKIYSKLFYSAPVLKKCREITGKRLRGNSKVNLDFL